MNKFKCGVCSISFRANSVREVAQAVSEAGLDCVEWGSDVHAPFNDPEKIAEIVALQEEYGISCSSYGTYFRLGSNNLDELCDYITTAKALGTDVLRLWCGTKGSADYTPEEKQDFFEECKKAAAIAEAEDVRLCMECHNGTLTDTADSALELMKAVDSPNFLMYWQPTLRVSVEYNMNYARLISPYVVNLHVYHWVNSEKRPLEEGKADWLQYLTCFEPKGAMLLEFMPDDSIDSLKREAQTLLGLA